MTDFTHQIPGLVPHHHNAIETLHWLQTEKFPWQLVTGSQQEIVGLLEKGGGADQALMRCIAAGQDRSLLSAADLMIPRSELLTLSYKQLANATIGDLLQALKPHGVRYCLILDGDKPAVRGLICAREITSQLAVKWDQRGAPTFVDIFTAVHP
jgi:hypothetical protein